MINRQIFENQVMHLFEQDTYLRVSYVSSKLMVSKPTTRRLLNRMVREHILKKELKLYSGNAYEYLYSRYWHGICFVANEVNLSNRQQTLILKLHDNESIKHWNNSQISWHTIASRKSHWWLSRMLFQASEILPCFDCRCVLCSFSFWRSDIQKIW